jgi:hypothetical protein
MAMPMVAVMRASEAVLFFVFSRSVQSFSFRDSPTKWWRRPKDNLRTKLRNGKIKN